MVYSAQEIIPDDMFATVVQSEELAAQIEILLREIKALKGPMEWTKEAQLAFRDFSLNHKASAPLHNRLTHYVTRRWMHLGKLIMISALSHIDLTVTIDNFNEALGWLLAAEKDMLEIFKDMITHEDGKIFEELRAQMFSIFMLGGRRPLHRSVLVKWLASRIATHNVERTIDIACAANLFARVAGTSGDDAEYIPLGGSTPSPGAI